MFVGHFAVGLGLKRAAPGTNLGWLIVAVCLLDIIWPVLLFAGVERVEIDPGNTAFTPLNFIYYPWTHSLAMAAVWAVAFAGAYFAITRYRAGAIAIGAGVVSHWFLDLVVHRPDLPLAPGGTAKFGLDLWDSVPATVVVESVMFAIGLWIYLSMTRSRDRTGKIAFWAFVVILMLSYAANLFSPPPSSWQAVAMMAPFVWVFVALAGWGDAHRETI